MKTKMGKLMSVLFMTGICAVMVMMLSAQAWAKYCTQCGAYNTDSNAYCIKCGFDFKTVQTKKMRVGVFFTSSVYPEDRAKFTIYYKGTITPFFVWNSKGESEIGETHLPILEDIEFVAIREKETPTSDTVQKIGKKYKVDKILFMDFNAKRTGRVPIFSSQTYEVHFDLKAYDVKTKEMLNEKRYSDSMKSWPDITTNQMKELCNSLWSQMIPNIHILLNN